MSMPGSPFQGYANLGHDQRQHPGQKTLSESALACNNKNNLCNNIEGLPSPSVQTNPSISPSTMMMDSSGSQPNNHHHENSNIISSGDRKIIPAKRRINSFEDRRTNSLPHHYKVRPKPIISLNGVELQEQLPTTTTPQSLQVSQRHKVDAHEFKKRMDVMTRWFSDFTDEQRTTALVHRLLPYLGPSQLHSLSNQLPKGDLHTLCYSGCSDILRNLPAQITCKIFNYLDPESLVNASLVCKYWNNMVETTCWTCWKRLCFLPCWRLSPQASREQLDRHSICDEEDSLSTSWKAIFVERFKLRRAWLRGRCHVRTFEGHSGGISCVQFDGSRIVSGSHDKTIRVWNIKTNSKWSVLTLAGHSGEVRCLHLEAGGNRLVSGSTDATIKGKFVICARQVSIKVYKMSRSLVTY